MQKSPPEDARGRWIDFHSAEELFHIKSMRRLKTLNPPNMAFESGGQVKALYPYSRFHFVFMCSNAPENWTASNNYNIFLRQWCIMCNYFSDEPNRAEPEQQYIDLFVDYTGLAATLQNIQKSFDDKLLISSECLVTQLKRKESAKAAPKKKKLRKVTPVSYKVCQGVQSKAMNEHAPNKRS